MLLSCCLVVCVFRILFKLKNLLAEIISYNKNYYMIQGC